MVFTSECVIDDVVLERVTGGANNTLELMLASFSKDDDRAFYALAGIVNQYRRTCEVYGNDTKVEGALDAVSTAFDAMDYAVTSARADKYLSWAHVYKDREGFLAVGGVTQ